MFNASNQLPTFDMTQQKVASPSKQGLIRKILEKNAYPKCLRVGVQIDVSQGPEILIFQKELRKITKMSGRWPKFAPICPPISPRDDIMGKK